MFVLIGEPSTTNYDLRFRVGSIPVRVHPLFWLVTLVMGYRQGDPAGVVAWVAMAFLSILVHELGHALAMVFYGQSPRIVLYGMGGLAISDGGGWARSKLVGATRSRPWVEQVVIAAAGPLAGFALAALTLLFVLALGGKVQFHLPTLESPFPVSIGLANRPAAMLVGPLLVINILWGMINLLPVFPLDGGQIARSLWVARDPWAGVPKSLWLSIFVAGAMAAVALFVWRQEYTGLLFAFLAVSNYLTLQSLGRGW